MNFFVDSWMSRIDGPFGGRDVTTAEHIHDLEDELANSPRLPLDERVPAIDMTYRQYLELQIAAAKEALPLVQSRVRGETPKRRQPIPEEWKAEAAAKYNRRVRVFGRYVSIQDHILDAVELVMKGVAPMKAAADANVKQDSLYKALRRHGITWSKRR